MPNRSSLTAWADKNVTGPSWLSAAARYLVRLLLITLNEFKNNELSLRSGALTYAILLSLVPMLAMSTAVVKGLGGGDQLRKAAYTYVETLEKSNSFTNEVPATNPDPDASLQAEGATDLTGHLRSAIDKLFDYVDRTNFTTLGSFGVLGILLSVLLVLGHIESAMNAIWKVSAGRSILRKIADYLTLLILMPISINVAFAAGAFLESPALAAKMDKFIPFDWLQTLLLKPLPIFFITLTFYAMYIFFPNTRVKTIPAMAGSLLAAVLWFAVQNVYIGLQVGVAKYNAIYGSFATLPLFLVWMYLGWMFILTGAQVAYAFQNIKTYRLISTPDVPSRKLGVAFDFMGEIYSAFAMQRSITADDFGAILPHHTAHSIEDVFEQLQQAGLVHVSQTDARVLPTLPEDQYDRGEIVKIMLGSDAPETTGGLQSLEAIEAAGEKSRQQVVSSGSPATVPETNNQDDMET